MHKQINRIGGVLVDDIQAHHRPDWGIVMVTGAILVLALANLVTRYGSAKYPSVSMGDRT